MNNRKQILTAVVSIALVFLLTMGGISFADDDGLYGNQSNNSSNTEQNTDVNGGGESGQTKPVNGGDSPYGNSSMPVGGASGYNGTVVGGAIPITDDQGIFDVSGIKDKTYNGKAQTQKIIVKNLKSGQTLTEGVDYSVKYSNNIKAGTASLSVEGKGNYSGSVTKTFKINKAANPITVTPKTAKIKVKNLKKGNQKLPLSKVMTIKGKQGTLSYKIVKVTKKKYKKYFKISKSGKVTVKKKLRKGTYKIKVKVTASGNNNYKGATKQVTFKVKVIK